MEDEQLIESLKNPEGIKSRILEDFTLPRFLLDYENVTPIRNSLSRAVAFSNDDKYFAWGGIQRVTVLQKDYNNNVNPYKIIHTFDCAIPVCCLAFSTKKIDNRCEKWIKTRQANRVTFHHFNEKDVLLAVGLKNGRIQLRSVVTGHYFLHLVDHAEPVLDVKFAPNGILLLISVSRDSTMKLWDFYDDGNRFKSVKPCGSRNFPICCAWSPTGKVFATGASDRQVLLWSCESWSIFEKLEGHRNNVTCCQFSPDGSLLATSSWDTDVILWDVYRRRILRKFWHMCPPPRLIFAGGENNHYVRYLSFSGYGDSLATVCDDGLTRIWSLVEVAPKTIDSVMDGDLAACSFSHGSRTLAVSTKHNRVWLHHVDTPVPSLSHLCRTVIRLWLCENDVKTLPLPPKIRDFVNYSEVALAGEILEKLGELYTLKK